MTSRDEILKLIIEHFIKTCEPVGSKVLKEAYGLEECSASIRSAMGMLEADGYIEKPHAAAGRVPTAKGYAYYVDHLRHGGVDETAKNALQGILSEKSKSIEEVMRQSCEVLSSMTNLASAVLGQGGKEERLVSIQLIPLGGTTASAVFVTDKGYVEHKTFVMEEGSSPERLASTVKLINDRLTGTPIGELVAKLEAMRPLLEDFLLGQEVLYDAIMGALAELQTERISVYGAKELMKQPEFQDVDSLKRLLRALEDPGRLVEGVSSGKKKDVDGVEIALGEDELEGLAIVSASVDIPSNPGVSLTLLGPKRMDYARAMATLRYFAEQLDRYFGGKGDSTWTKKKESSPAKSAGKTKKTPSSAKKKAKKANPNPR